MCMLMNRGIVEFVNNSHTWKMLLFCFNLLLLVSLLTKIYCTRSDIEKANKVNRIQTIHLLHSDTTYNLNNINVSPFGQKNNFCLKMAECEFLTDTAMMLDFCPSCDCSRAQEKGVSKLIEFKSCVCVLWRISWFYYHVKSLIKIIQTRSKIRIWLLLKHVSIE